TPKRQLPCYRVLSSRFFPPGLSLDLTATIAVPLRACHLAFPAPCFPRRLYGGRLARAYSLRRDFGLRPLGPHCTPPPAARPPPDPRPPSSAGTPTRLLS